MPKPVLEELADVGLTYDPVPESDEFFTSYKEELKQRFRQEDILLTAHLVEVF